MRSRTSTSPGTSRSRRPHLLLLAALLVACADGGGEGKGEAAARSRHALDCAALLPESLVRAHLPGAEIQPVTDATSVTALCRLRAGDRAIEVGYTCVGDPARALDRSLTAAAAGVEEIAGAGRRAHVLTYGPSAPTATVLVADDDTGCWLSASAPAGHDHAALARDLAEALDPEAITR